MPNANLEEAANSRSSSRTTFLALVEVGLIFVLFFVLAGGTVPDVNEAHYLSKAKHYWNPDWCAGDLLLESADAHLVFYWSVGWLTYFLPLPAVAWIGRCWTWWLLAWTWRRLSVSIVPGPLWSLLTAAIFATLLRWTHMAGEWVVGGVEAKGFAFVFVFLGLEALVRSRWRLAWVWFGCASAFHVLIGGWAVIAGMIAWGFSGRDRPSIKSMFPALCLGGAVSLAGLIPGLLLTAGVSPDVAAEANEIYVHKRLAHHLLFHNILAQPIAFDFQYLGFQRFALPFSHLYFLRHFVAILIGVALWKFARLTYQSRKGVFSGRAPALRSRSVTEPPEGLRPTTRVLHEAAEESCMALPTDGVMRLCNFVGGALLIAGMGILLDQATMYQEALSAKLMRYYWFRLSDVMVPVGVAMLTALALQKLQQINPIRSQWALAICMLLVTGNTSDIFFRRTHNPRPTAITQPQSADLTDRQAERCYQDWLATCHWISTHTDEAAIFLTPRHQQTFKWYANRGEVVAWKDIPQDAAGIVEWQQRMDEVFPGRVGRYDLALHGELELRRLATKYGASYVVIDRSRSQQSLALTKVYPKRWQGDSCYEVYRLPTLDE